MLLTELSARFVSVTSKILDEIVNALRQIVHVLELDRSTSWQLLFVSAVSTIYPTKQCARSRLPSGLARSNVTFPLKVGGKVIGALAFGTVLRERQWPDAIVNRLRLFVEMIGSAIARTRAKIELGKKWKDLSCATDFVKTHV
jgi:formate hydrogenlyase transcriptional activator